MAEIFDIVDENDRVIGRATREECHSNPDLMHRSICILIFNSKGDLLLQKRSMKKDLNPGKWTTSVSGHVKSGNNYEEAAKRELEEELGISLPMEKLFVVDLRLKQESEMSMVFRAKSNGPFKPDPEEVDEVRFFSIEEIKRMLQEKSGMLTPCCRIVLKGYFKRFP